MMTSEIRALVSRDGTSNLSNDNNLANKSKEVQISTATATAAELVDQMKSLSVCTPAASNKENSKISESIVL